MPIRLEYSVAATDSPSVGGPSMKMGWLTKTVGSTCDIFDSRRKPITKCDRTAGPYPYYGATGILDFVEGYLFDEPLVLVGEDGAKWASGDNTAFAVDGKYWVNNHAHVLRPDRSVLLDKWLIHFLVHSDLGEFVSGLTVPKLNQGSLREIPVPVPPLAEQQRIVTLLDEAFASIATAKANAEKNLQNAQALVSTGYQAITEGYDSSKCPIVQVTSLAASHKGSVRTGPFGSQLLHSEFVDDGIAVLGIDNAVKNEFRWDRRRYITAEKYRQLSRYRVLPGDVLITIMGTCGRCAVVPEDIPQAINTKHLCCITLDRRKCLPEFLHIYFLYDALAKDYLNAQAKGSIMAGLNMGIILELPVRLPSLQQQAEIVQRFSSLRAECLRLESIYQQKLAALEELKKSLLHQAFSGHL
jgi:type I restriction enzyme, S subunit